MIRWPQQSATPFSPGVETWAGRQRPAFFYALRSARRELYRGAEYTVDLLPKIKLEVALTPDQVDRAVEAIARAAKTGQIGDGKIFVYDLNQTVRIRTGESGVEAV
ncbi:MAG: hypothetical protein NVSMB20_22990 [Bradyrhizobium sp.]